MKWIEEAKKHLGLTEITGPQHHPTIQAWLKFLNAWWSDDETPWCGVFVAYCIKKAGLPIPKNWMRAKEWATWGTKLSAPIPGCIAVFERQGGGHVGFVEGVDNAGRLMILGGNQGNSVSIAPFDKSRIVAFVWPEGVDIESQRLPVINSKGQKSSTDEA